MKVPKKIISILTVSILASSMCTNISNAGIKNTTSEALVGLGRYETAIKISQNGWSSNSTKEAVIVNDSAIADALSATPFAKAKNAPILLTGSKNLDSRTKTELKRIGINKVYLIGGTSVLSTNVENQLKSEGISIDRIYGNDRYETSLKLAERLNSIKSISKIAVVNGAKGLADAVSVGAPAAQNNIPIILADPIKGTQTADSFIKSKSIKTSYVIGGESVVPNSTSSKLSNVKRLGGSTRSETNAKVIDEFYKKSNLNAIYITKDGGHGENQLIDALSVGVLAAKKESPVMLVGNGLTTTQKNLVNGKNLDKVVQVGGNGNESAFELVKSVQKKTTYKVDDIDDIEKTIAKADANDVVTIDIDDDVDEDITIKSNHAISVILKDDYTEEITINLPNGEVTNEGDLEDVTIDNISFGTFINEGDIDTLTVEDNDGCKIENTDDGTIKTLEVISSAKNVWIENDGDIETLDNDSDTTVLDDDGDIDDIIGREDVLDPDDVDEDDYNGGIVGNNKDDDDDDDDDDDEDDYVRDLVKSVDVEDQNTIVVEFKKKATGVEFYWEGDRSSDEIDDVDDSSDKKTYTINLDEPMTNDTSYDLTIKKSGHKKYTKTVKYNESLKNYLGDKSTGEYKLSENVDLTGITLKSDKVINLGNKKLIIDGTLNAGKYKITIKGSGTVTFKNGFKVTGEGSNGTIIINNTTSGSTFEKGNEPSGYEWTSSNNLVKADDIAPTVSEITKGTNFIEFTVSDNVGVKQIEVDSSVYDSQGVKEPNFDFNIDLPITPEMNTLAAEYGMKVTYASGKVKIEIFNYSMFASKIGFNSPTKIHFWIVAKDSKGNVSGHMGYEGVSATAKQADLNLSNIPN